MCQILGRVDIWKGAHGSVGEREVCKPVIGTQPDKNHNETGKKYMEAQQIFGTNTVRLRFK